MSQNMTGTYIQAFPITQNSYGTTHIFEGDIKDILIAKISVPIKVKCIKKLDEYIKELLP